MNRSAALYSLQQIDDEIGGRAARLAELVTLLGETERLAQARERVRTTREAVSSWRMQQRDQELRLQSLNEKKRASEQKLYGGRIHNPKELSDLQEETASLERRKSVLEDRVLEIMLSLEEAERDEEEAARACQRIEAEWETGQANHGSEKETQEAHLKALAAERQQHISNISQADLTTYEQIRQRRGGLAVVLLIGSECQGCMTTVSVTRAKEAHRDTLACCGTCGRILFPG